MSDIENRISELRQMADFLEQHKERLGKLRYGFSVTHLYVGNDDHLSNYVSGMGQVEKCADEFTYYLKRKFGETIIAIRQDREYVCRRIEKTVVKPAQDEIVIPAKPERMETEVSWECPESLLSERHEPELEAVGEVQS